MPKGGVAQCDLFLRVDFAVTHLNAPLEGVAYTYTGIKVSLVSQSQYGS